MMNSLKVKMLAAAALTLTVFVTAPASAWYEGIRVNGWSNGWSNHLSSSLNGVAESHALRVIGIEFPAE